jgi:hypothetical protein
MRRRAVERTSTMTDSSSRSSSAPAPTGPGESGPDEAERDTAPIVCGLGGQIDASWGRDASI